MITMKIPRTQSGFTILELLLYTGISSAILLAVSLFLSSLLQSRVKNQTIAEVEQQGAQVMQVITQATRNAVMINSPAQGATSTSLSVNTYYASTTPTIFDVATGTIRITEDGVGAIALTNNRVTVSNIIFQNLSRASTPGIVRVQFTLTYNSTSTRNEYTFSKTFISSAALRWP